MKTFFSIFFLAFAQAAFAQSKTFSETAREIALHSGVGDKTVTQRDGSNVLLLNKNIFVQIATTNGVWDAAWLGKTDAAIERADFALEWNGKIVRLDSSPIETRAFTNDFGSGIEARQKAGDEVQFERMLRVYDGKPVLTLSVKITN